MKRRSFLIGLLSVCATFTSETYTEARAQDVCSVDEVSQAINQLDCYADGVYFAPESLATAVADLCYDEYSDYACEACFARARRKLFPVMKTLAKLDLISRGSLGDFRQALDEAEAEVCYPSNDWPWDGSGDKSKGTSSAKPAHASERSKGVDTRKLVEDFCPCESPRWAQSNGREDFLGCADTVLDILKRNGKLNDRKAEDLKSQLERSRCGQ